MRKYLFVFATLALLGLLGNAPGNPVQKSDKDKIKGTWSVESLEVGGKPIPAEFIKDFKLVFTDSKATVVGKDDEEATFTLDASKNPKTIDMTDTKGKDKGKMKKGIYTFDGDDKLKMAFPSSDNGARPTEFKSKEGSDVVLIVLKREKAK